MDKKLTNNTANYLKTLEDIKQRVKTTQIVSMFLCTRGNCNLSEGYFVKLKPRGAE